MDFIEREKLRIEEEQKKKDAEKKAKEDLAKRKELELQNKRDSIYKKVGPFMEQLLQKTIEKQKQAEAEKLPDPLQALQNGEEVFKGWKWEIDWEDTTPRLWGHFEIIEGYLILEFYEEGELGESHEYYDNGHFNDQGISTRFLSYNYGNWIKTEYWTIYIKCLVDVDKMVLSITAKSEKYSNTRNIKDDCDRNDHDQDNSKSLQAPYLGKKGLIIPITNDDSFIDRIADLLIEIRYTWKFNVIKKVLKNIRYKSINKSLKYLETSLQSYDNLMNEIKKKNPEEFAKRVGLCFSLPAWILFIIYMINVNGVAGGIFLGIIGGAFIYGIVYLIIHGISKLLASSFGYSNKEDEKKDSLEIRHKKNDISDLLKNLRATIDNDNIEEFVGDGIFLEFPLTDKLADGDNYTKKDLTSKINSMIERSKYEEK